jgi:hypothetical protein
MPLNYLGDVMAIKSGQRFIKENRALVFISNTK